ncbi:HD domain-containing protein [Bilifractor porci]|uniref:HD domain-containing protein n=1 Tax=Bilifractor porci TaxID=2606636 RepID=A0A7X2P7A7_9FIRM|nr:hypothetical protein [Bilifractor porci]MST81537.1 hypothetical protein [Bilifractor porci]
MDNKKYVVDRLMSTGREGMCDLISYMDEVGFFEAPCSGGNHLCCKYGLVQHTRNVMMAAENIGYALLGKKDYEEIRPSVIIVSALHDLGKCGDFGKPLYVPNMIKNKKYKKSTADTESEYIQSDAKPYERNKNLTNVPHSFKSASIAWRFIDLTEDEEYAIMYHDGLYDRETGGMAIIPGHETPLYIIVHTADLWSARITEGEK